MDIVRAYSSEERPWVELCATWRLLERDVTRFHLSRKDNSRRIPFLKWCAALFANAGIGRAARHLKLTRKSRLSGWHPSALANYVVGAKQGDVEMIPCCSWY